MIVLRTGCPRFKIKSLLASIFFFLTAQLQFQYPPFVKFKPDEKKIVCKLQINVLFYQIVPFFKVYWLFQGLGKEFIFSHHQKAYEGNRISWYDQQFNKREITESRLPPLRSWDRQKLAWAPEKSDYPTQGLF